MIEFLQTVINGITIGSTYALTGLGLTVIYSVYRILNLSHGEFYMIGAYISYFCSTLFHIPFLLCIPISMVVTGLVGLVAERLVFRPLKNHSESDYLITTLGLLFFLENLALYIWTPNIRTISSPFENGTFDLAGLTISAQRLFIVILTVILIVALHYFYYHTKLGKQMRAVSQDRQAAQLMGVDVTRIGKITFFIAATLAAVAGTLMGDLQSINPTMGFSPLLMAVIVVIFGGLGSIVGAIVGGLVLGIAQSLAVTYFSAALSNMVVYLILFIILMLRPSGIFGRRAHD